MVHYIVGVQERELLWDKVGELARMCIYGIRTDTREQRRS